MLLLGRDVATALLVNLTIFPLGCTYNVSTPSVAPISAVAGLARFGVIEAFLEGRVKERFKANLEGVCLGVVGGGAVVDMAAASALFCACGLDGGVGGRVG
jgi:hypothetical protein